MSVASALMCDADVGLLGRKLFASTKLGSLYKNFVNNTAAGIMRGNAYVKYIAWLVQAMVLFVAISSDDQVLTLATGLLPVSQTPRLGVMMKPEVVHGDEKNIQQRVQA